MAIYNYVAVNDAGKTHKGVLEGDSTSNIRRTLNERGLMPLEITLATDDKASETDGKSSSIFNFFKGPKKISASNLSVITYQFSTLISAGMPVESALENIASEIDNQKIKRILMGVRDKVLEGHSLANGMQEYPSAFPPLYVASVSVGEKTGQLDRVLQRLADYYENQCAVQEKIFQALIYPALLTIVSAGIIVFLLTYVIPEVTEVFTATGQALPGITVLLLTITELLNNYGIQTLLVIIAMIFAFSYYLRKKSFRTRVQLLLLKIPVLNQTIIAVNAARFSRTFGLLFAAGVPVIDAMTSSNSILTLIPMQTAINDAIKKVGEGSSIHQALQDTGYFSSLSNQLIASGEASGELEVMLEKAAMFQEKATTRKLNTALALFEPILILAMGCLVLFIVLAILLPIFEMNQFIF